MCRLIAYHGKIHSLGQFITKPEHSLLVQSQQPKEMKSGVVNADGFGIGWYHPQHQTKPFIYKHIVPIWNDTNLVEIGRFVETGCMVGHVRSATEGQAISISNCQPFGDERLLFVHNGAIENFRGDLCRQIRERLQPKIYQSIDGTTDSEHIFALLVNELLLAPELPLELALKRVLHILQELVIGVESSVSANIVLSDGVRTIASCFAYGTETPSLYWLKDGIDYPDAVIVASEPICDDNWQTFPSQSIMTVEWDLNVNFHPI